jgi:DNA repair exonuclease SbcCD nuclease subunit
VSAQLKDVTLVHTSDIHLGSGYHYDEYLEKIVDVVQLPDVNGLLIAGDLFDHKEVSQQLVFDTFKKLGETNKPTVILPGNHDTLLTNSNLGFHTPSNIHILLKPEGESVLLADLGVNVWGRPVYNHTPEFRPLDKTPDQTKGVWNILMAHGMVVDSLDDNLRSSPITIGDLTQVDCDYVALGHVHAFRQILAGDTIAYYPGTPSGIYEKTLIKVTFESPKRVSVNRVDL